MKLDRLMGILTILLQNERVTAPFLADKFEVNRRTISRDIDTLCQAGIPLITHQGNGGGISIAEGFKLDKSVLTLDELGEIIAAIKGLGSVSEKAKIERTLDKLGANTNAVISLREPVVIDLASYYKNDLTIKIEQLKRAILDTKIVAFDYHYEKGETFRRIEPYLVIFQWSSWYVFGYCPKRQDWRMFKLNRLLNLVTLEENFPKRDIPIERRDFFSHLTDEHILKAIFDKSVRYLLIESYGFDSFYETDAGLHFEIGYTNKNYMVSWLLGFGANVKVLEPQCLVLEIKAITKKILSQYET